jgi:malonyl-CoA/methylmalonyl-CoA synthetase
MSGGLWQVAAAAMGDPSRAFIETPQGRTISFADLADQTGRIASALAAGGVRPGDRVAAQIDKSPEAILLYLATVRAGAAFLPLNPAYTAAEVAYFLGDAEPAMTVCRPRDRDAVAALAAGFGGAVATMDAAGEGSLMAAAAAAGPGFAEVPRAPDDLAAILYTSGTTGRPKGAMLTHRNLVSNAEVLVEAWRFSADDVLIHALPVFHTHGLFVATNVALFAGSRLLFLARFDPAEVLGLMPRATAMMGVPTYYTRLLDHPGLTREAAAGMRLFVSGSAPLLAETHRAFEERTGHAILERYGMTETGMNVSAPYDGERVPGTVGLPLPGVEMRIADAETGAPVPPGEIGVVELRGPNVFKGYWRNPEKTAEEFRNDCFFVTGDLGRVDRRGYLHIVGRAKDLVISGGLNVYPKEVEAEIDQIEGVRESAVIGLAHPDFGEGVTAVVVTANGAGLTEPDIVGALAMRLANYKLPKRVFFVDELPRNPMGKVQKNVLRERFAGAYGQRA